MKHFRLLIVFVSLFGFFPITWAQEKTPPIQKAIVEAMSQGDANKLAQHMNVNVELIIANKKNIYSKQQAIGILANFFKDNTVKEFTLAHNSDKKAASFLIGSLKTEQGNFRVYFLTREVDKATLVQQIRIETEK